VSSLLSWCLLIGNNAAIAAVVVAVVADDDDDDDDDDDTVRAFFLGGEFRPSVSGPVSTAFLLGNIGNNAGDCLILFGILVT
jgi:hypothetical protein